MSESSGFLSDRINSISESETIAMARKSRELQAKGIDIVNLSLGEPDFNTPDFIKTAAKEAIDKNFSKYMPVAGYADLREAISKKFKRENNLNYSAEQIVVSTGAKQSIANAMLCLLNPCDEVLVPAPYWVSYIEIIKLTGASAVVIPSGISTNFKITAAQLKKYVTPKTKMLVYSSPCNPTGSVYTKEELKSIAELIASYKNIFIIADEIYEYINYAGKHESIAQFIYDRTITINGMSKGYAMTGWRIGYMGAPLAIAQACDKLQGQFTSGASSIAQRAALAAMNGTHDTIEVMKKAFLRRRDMILDLLREIPGLRSNVPDGAFYVFPEVKSYFGKKFNGTALNNADDLSMYLLTEGHVATVSGGAFGDKDCIRISYAASEEQIREAVKRIKISLSRLS
ncbi:MAG: pyridoxal phosphate-dependent aminotransferase [Bacteroidetes bacterium]|nr:MAG: pyridoxal phosphate-dependent aminotransferase [Bacteroidota bacterium]